MPLLALIYLLLLAVTRELTSPAGEAGERRAGLWLALGLTTWVGLHLHYMVIFVVVYVSAWALFIFVRQRRWVDFRRWLLVMYLVGLASLPWLLAVLRNWTNVRSEAVAGTFGYRTGTNFLSVKSGLGFSSNRFGGRASQTRGGHVGRDCRRGPFAACAFAAGAKRDAPRYGRIAGPLAHSA